MSEYNEEAYRQARKSSIALACPFERALLSRCVACGLARKVLLAEREAISCTEGAANDRCRELHAALHANARFTVRLEPGQPWPFGKEIRAQCGGLLGLSEVMSQEEGGPPDVAALLAEAVNRFGSVSDLPYSRIMRAVAHYEPRRRQR